VKKPGLADLLATISVLILVAFFVMFFTTFPDEFFLLLGQR
jgi:hypothetical protein